MTYPYPLQWPPGWTRTAPLNRGRARFTATLSSASALLKRELKLFGIEDYNAVLTTDAFPSKRGFGPYSSQPNPDDPGAAVYFRLKDTRYVLASDRYDRLEHNIKALALTVKAMRDIQRWGTGGMRMMTNLRVSLLEPANAVYDDADPLWR